MDQHPTLRVRAVGPHRVDLYDAVAQAFLRGRYAGRDATGAPAVTVVHDDAYYHRHVRDGVLELVEAGE